MLHPYKKNFQRTRLLWVILWLSWVASPLYAQVATNYAFSQNSGTYTPIIGGTVLGTGTAVDDNNYNNQPIGFTFNYNGTNYTNFSLNSNGFIAMGATVSSSWSPISGGTTNNVISALGFDLQGLATGEIRYETIGTAPNRVLVAQWTDFRAWNETGDEFDFQIRLHETSNEIRVVYGSFTKNATTRTPQVGLRGATNTDFNNRTTTTNWSASTAGAANNATMTLSPTVLPASGLEFIWSPPPPCIGTPPTLTASVSPTSACLGSNITLSVNPIFAGNITYQWQYGSGSSWTNIAGATSATSVVSMIPAYAGQQFRCEVTCTNSGITTPSNPSAAVTLSTPTYASLPVIESFEGSPTWQSVCGTRDVPNNNWRNTPVTGNNSWRRNDDAAGGGWSFPTSGAYTPPAAPGFGNFSARFHSYGAGSGQQGSLDLHVNLSTPGIKQISFFFINTNGGDVLDVQLSTDGGITFTTLGTSDTASNWTAVSYITTATSATSVIRFLATSDFGSTDIGLDGVVVQPVNIQVEGLGGNVVANGSTPSPVTGTNYGTIAIGGTKDRTFTLRNIGASTINVFSLNSSNPTNFPIAAFPAIAIPPGGTTTFTIRFTASAASTYTSNITLNTSGIPNPYTFQVSGVAGDFVSNYAFSQCSSTYTEITGGTVLFSGAGWDDDNTSVTIPSFTFNGSTFTSAHFNTNGYIVLGGVINTFSGVISNTATLPSGGAIAGFSGDLQGQAGSEIRYEQVGNEAVFQWKGAKRFGTTGDGDNINFQIRLNTANGQVRVVYGASTTTSTSSSGIQVGLRGIDNTDFNNRESATSWSSTVEGTANNATVTYSSSVNPPSGLTFIWSPVPFEVLGGSPLVLIANGDLTPDPADGTEMGETSTTTAISRTFTIRNNTASNLTISTITSSNPLFTISAAPASVGTCASNTATFVVNFAHNVIGSYSSDITVNGVYTFRVRASVSDPDINVQGNSVNIPTGSNAPNLADHTDFDNVDATIAPGYFDRTFTIENTAASGTLTIGTITISNPRFTLVTAPASTVAPGGSTTFTIRFTPTTSGVQNATVSIANNDPDEAPYTFAIRATGVQPVMQVLGLDNNIPNNKFLSTTTDGTFMGVATSTAPITATFTIRNNGNSNLNISGITMAGGSPFAITGAPTSVAPGSDATFNVVYSPTDKGAQDTVLIASNFPSIPVFRFLVSAGGVISSLDNLQEGELLISPNPSRGNFNIKIGGAKYTSVKAVVYDMAGRRMKDVEVPQFNGSMDINLEDLQGGTYILMLETGGERVARKLIKQ